MQIKFIQFKHYFLKLTSVSPCQISEEISDFPTNQLHSPNPEGEIQNQHQLLNPLV